MLLAAGRHGMRVLGPNCVGLLVPGVGLNGSCAHVAARPGDVAFVSQSEAMCTAALDWAHSRGLGFSHFVSLGNSRDVDASDVLDYLSADPATHAILLYLEGRTEARKLMSASRAAARNKPVIVIKSGRVQEGARAAASHTGALAGADDVFDAAFRRAGMLRVDRVDELFDAAETLARAKGVRGDPLMIPSNGGGPGVMATDARVRGGGRLAALPDAVRASLSAALPETWSNGNPIELVGDAPGQRYADALRAIASADTADAILVIHAPTAVASSEAAACAVADTVRETRPHVPVLTSWMGGGGSESARRALRDAKIATYDTPEDAVRAFLHMVAYRTSQEPLRETPAAVPDTAPPDVARARRVVQAARAAGREWMQEVEAKEILDAYGVPVVHTKTARTAESAAKIATERGFPVALEIVSPEIAHKSNVGGVALDLETPKAVIDADGSGETAELAVIVRRDMKGHGLGRALVEKMIRYARARRLRELRGQILGDNRAMLALADELGFERDPDTARDVVDVRLPLGGR